MKLTDPRTGKEVILWDATAYHEELGPTWKGCEHPSTEMRRFTNRNGGTAACLQCLTCGRRVGNPQGGVDHGSLPTADESIEPRFLEARKAERDRIAIKHIDAQSGQDAEWWERYNAYLQTDEWREKRDLVLRRCNWVCEGCLDAEATEVHHMTYEHVFEEFLFELKGLCHACHERWHQSGPRP